MKGLRSSLRVVGTILLMTGLLSNVASESLAAGTLDWQFWDFFNVPPGEYFDIRSAVYQETPIGAECWWEPPEGETGYCTPNTADSVQDYASYPYTMWSYTNEITARRTLTAPYRFSATGVDIPGYDLTDPIFLPVLNSNEPAGTYLTFTWNSRFLDHGVLTEMANAVQADGITTVNCVNPGRSDGYYNYSVIELEMDLQQSKRIFGVVAADATAAQTWWDDNTDSGCGGNPPPRGPVENDMYDWFRETGGDQMPTVIGTYDIMNAYGWHLDQVFLDISAVVDPDGTTHVKIHHEAWGTTNLLNRFFYWGSAPYKDNYLDSTQAAGWQGMEPYGWYDDMIWSGTLNAADIDFVLSGALWYHFEQISLPADNDYDRVDDFSVWTWRPHLHDNLNDLYSHPLSELDRYPGVQDTETAPGSPLYGQSQPRAFIPTTWDLAVGETLTFQFPTGSVPFYDPNLTPIGAVGKSNDHVVISAPLGLQRTHPPAYGNWDPVAKTWTITGPTTTGGSVGSPGDYPDESWGAIYFVVPEPGSTIALVAGSGMLAMMYRRRSRRSGTI